MIIIILSSILVLTCEIEEKTGREKYSRSHKIWIVNWQIHK